MDKKLENPYDKKINEIVSIDSGDFGFSTEGAIITNREDLRKFIEEPCLKACLFLYDKNIRTISSSANKREIGGKAYIGINYDSLDEVNKQILEELIEAGSVKKPRLSDDKDDRGGRDVMIQVPVFEEDTVGIVSDRFMQIVSDFQEQDVLYGKNAAEPLINQMFEKYSELLHPNENGEVEFEEVVDLIASIYGFVYDSELDIFWDTQDLYDKHNKFQSKKNNEKEENNKGENNKMDLYLEK